MKFDRRSFLIAWLELWLFALFPGLRPKPEICTAVAEKLYDRLPQRIVFKGGEFKISMLVRGYEVDDDWYKVLQEDPELKKAILEECGAVSVDAPKVDDG